MWFDGKSEEQKLIARLKATAYGALIGVVIGVVVAAVSWFVRGC